MPEGPEIIITSQFLTTKIKKRKIDEIKILKKNVKGDNLIENTPITINSIDSKGKFMWFDLTDKNGKKFYMLNTFGLTGRWTFNEEKNSRIVLTMKSNTINGKIYHLYFVDDINYGTIEFTDNVDVLNHKINKLAPDILKSNINNEEIVKRIESIISKSRKNLNLVKILMDQETLVSGIGNYLVAEILYDAKLDPHRQLSDLSKTEMFQLAQSMRKVSKCAYYCNNSGYMTFFDDFMKTHSQKIDSGVFPNYQPDIIIDNEFKFNVYQKKTDPYGHYVQKDKIMKDRTIHWVPNIQK